MIFRQMNEVRNHTKTQTRRLMDKGRITNRWYLGGEEDDRINEILTPRKKPTKYGDVWHSTYVLDHTYAAVPKMFQKAFGKIKITNIRVEHLQDITEADAIAEGITAVPLSQTLTPAYQTAALPGQTFPTARDCYFALWDSINTKKGIRAADNPLVCVLTFEYQGDINPA